MNADGLVKLLELAFPSGVIHRAEWPKLSRLIIMMSEVEGAPPRPTVRDAGVTPSPPPKFGRPRRRAPKRFVFKPSAALVQAVKAALAKATRPVTAREIAAATGLDNAAVHRVLPSLAQVVGKEDKPGFVPKARLWVPLEAQPQEAPP